MQTFKAFYKTTTKHIGTIIMYVVIFLIISFMMSTMLSEKISEVTLAKVNIAVFDYDNSVLSKGLYDYLNRTHTIIDIEDNDEIIKDELFNRNVAYVLTIPEGFSEDFTKLYHSELPGSMYSTLIDSQINQYLNTLSAYSYENDETAVKLTDEAISHNVKINSFNETASGTSHFYNFFLYLSYTFIALVISSLGAILIIFRNKDLSARIQCSALSITKRNLSLTACCAIYSLVIWALFMIMGICMFGGKMFDTRGLLLMVNSLAILIVAVALTYFISFFASLNTLNIAANILGLGSSFLCGVFIPTYILSDSVLNVAKFLPSYWYVKACDIIYYSSEIDHNTYWSCIGIQLLFAAALFAAALAASRIKKKA